MSKYDSSFGVNLNDVVKIYNSNNADDALVSLLMNEEQLANDGKENNDDKKHTSQAGIKNIIGSLSEEMFCTLS